MVRPILQWVYVLGVVYVVWNVGPVYLAYHEFKTKAAEVTRVGGRGAERELVAEVAELAERIGVPVAREAITVRKEGTHTYLEVTYTEEIRLVPAVTYPWTFSIIADGLAMKPRTLGDVLGSDRHRRTRATEGCVDRGIDGRRASRPPGRVRVAPAHVRCRQTAFASAFFSLTQRAGTRRRR